jgi:type I restriction enzyme S subunit
MLNSKAECDEAGGLGLKDKGVVNLRSLVSARGLQTGPFGSQLKAEEYTVDGIPVVMPKDINEGKIVEKGIARVSKKKAEKLAKHRLTSGDILFPRRGDLGRIAVVKEENAGYLCGTGCLRARLKSNISSDYIHQYVQMPLVKKWLESNALGQTMLNLNTDIIGNLPIFIVSIDQQKAIAKFLYTWDQNIEKTERLIATKERQYKQLLHSLVSKARYPRVHIRDFAIEVSKRNNGAAINLVLSVTNRNGFVLPEDQFERRVASADLSNYKIVSGGQFAYNPSRINVGSIARLDKWDNGVLSPMYVVFEIDKTKINSDFFLHWLSSHQAQERIRKSAQGSVRETVSFSDLGAISFPLPPISEQNKIAEILNTAKSEIDILKKQLGAYRRQKRGLMQKLLTGKCILKSDNMK